MSIWHKCCFIWEWCDSKCCHYWTSVQLQFLFKAANDFLYSQFKKKTPYLPASIRPAWQTHLSVSGGPGTFPNQASLQCCDFEAIFRKWGVMSELIQQIKAIMSPPRPSSGCTLKWLGCCYCGASLHGHWPLFGHCIRCPEIFALELLSWSMKTATLQSSCLRYTVFSVLWLAI